MAVAEAGAGPQIGGKIRRLRRARKISQADLAAALDISASYLNLIEHNRRTLTAPLLLKLAGQFGLEIADIKDSDEGRLAGDLMEVLGDDLFTDLDMTNLEVRDLAFSNPAAARAFIHLYDRFRTLKADGGAPAADRLPTDEETEPEQAPATDPVSDFLQAHGNHFSTLEAAAERVAGDLDFSRDTRERAMGAFLLNAFGVHLRVEPLGNRGHRRFDPDTGVLQVADTLPQASRVFEIARQLGLLVAAREIEAIVQAAQLASGDAANLARGALASYFAGALMMPYERFFKAATATRYDIERLERLFAASFEQVCHRLTTLQRPGAQGVPLHFVRTDIAGNISKRFSLSGIHIPRYSGACPRWNVYTAFLQPDRVNVQISQMPDGRTFFCIARTLTKGGQAWNAPRQHFSVGLGCDIAHAKSLVYSDGIDLKNPALVVPIGVNCRVCPRMDCAQRALPPAAHRLELDPSQRGVSPYTAPGEIPG